MSRTVRKLATFLNLLVSWYIFHFDLLMKCISSYCVKLQRLFIRKVTHVASTHSTVRWRCGGHRRNWGRTSHSTGMFAADVRRVLAMILFVRPHVVVASSHSVRRCPVVSLLPQSLQMIVGDILIRWSLTFVGIMTCITVYHVAVSNPDTGAACKFFQIVTQSAFGHNFVIFMSWCVLSVLISAFRFVCRRLLYVFAGCMQH